MPRDSPRTRTWMCNPNARVILMLIAYILSGLNIQVRGSMTLHHLGAFARSPSFALGEDRLCSFCAHSSKHVALESQSEARVLPSNRRAKLAFCPMCCPRIAERSSRFARRLPNPLSLHAMLPRTSGKLAVLYMGLLPCLVPLQFNKVVDGPLWYHRTAYTK